MMEVNVKRIRVILTMVTILFLTLALFWRPIVVTPNIGLTREARTELEQVLEH